MWSREYILDQKSQKIIVMIYEFQSNLKIIHNDIRLYIFKYIFYYIYSYSYPNLLNFYLNLIKQIIYYANAVLFVSLQWITTTTLNFITILQPINWIAYSNGKFLQGLMFIWFSNQYITNFKTEGVIDIYIVIFILESF